MSTLPNKDTAVKSDEQKIRRIEKAKGQVAEAVNDLYRQLTGKRSGS